MTDMTSEQYRELGVRYPWDVLREAADVLDACRPIGSSRTVESLRLLAGRLQRERDLQQQAEDTEAQLLQ